MAVGRGPELRPVPGRHGVGRTRGERSPRRACRAAHRQSAIRASAPAVGSANHGAEHREGTASGGRRTAGTLRAGWLGKQCGGSVRARCGVSARLRNGDRGRPRVSTGPLRAVLLEQSGPGAAPRTGRDVARKLDGRRVRIAQKSQRRLVDWASDERKKKAADDGRSKSPAAEGHLSKSPRKMEGVLRDHAPEYSTEDSRFSDLRFVKTDFLSIF